MPFVLKSRDILSQSHSRELAPVPAPILLKRIGREATAPRMRKYSEALWGWCQSEVRKFLLPELLGLGRKVVDIIASGVQPGSWVSLFSFPALFWSPRSSPGPTAKTGAPPPVEAGLWRQSTAAWGSQGQSKKVGVCAPPVRLTWMSVSRGDRAYYYVYWKGTRRETSGRFVHWG